MASNVGAIPPKAAIQPKTYDEVVKEALQCKKDNYKVAYFQIPEEMNAVKKNWEALKGKATDADLDREIDIYIHWKKTTDAATTALQKIVNCYQKTIVECQPKPLDKNTLQELERFGAKLDKIEKRGSELVKKMEDFKREAMEITSLMTRIGMAFSDARLALDYVAYPLKGSFFSYFGSTVDQLIEARKSQPIEGEKKTK